MTLHEFQTLLNMIQRSLIK